MSTLDRDFRAEAERAGDRADFDAYVIKHWLKWTRVVPFEEQYFAPGLIALARKHLGPGLTLPLDVLWQVGRALSERKGRHRAG